MTSIRKRLTELEKTVALSKERIAENESTICELKNSIAALPQKKVDWTNTDFMRQWQYGEEDKK